MQTLLTKSQIEEIKSSIATTERILVKELKYSEDLQKKQMIADLRNQILHFTSMLKNGFTVNIIF